MRFRSLKVKQKQKNTILKAKDRQSEAKIKSAKFWKLNFESKNEKTEIVFDLCEFDD